MTEEKKGFFKRLVSGLTKTRDNIASSFENIFSGFSKIDDDFYDELEETMIMADLGIETTTKIIDDLKVRVKEAKIKQPEECREMLINIIKNQMLVEDDAYDFEEKKAVVLIIGVNGVGKTTSIGKLAAQYKAKGKKVILAAADTFRAAAIEQLTELPSRKVLTLQQLYMMPLLLQNPEMQIFYYAIQPEDFITKRILWMN